MGMLILYTGGRTSNVSIVCSLVLTMGLVQPRFPAHCFSNITLYLGFGSSSSNGAASNAEYVLQRTKQHLDGFRMGQHGCDTVM